MSERELRKALEESDIMCSGEAVCSRCRPIRDALAAEPDVVKAARIIKAWLRGGEIQDIIAEHVKIGWESYEDNYVAYVDKVPEAAQAVVQEIEWDVIESIERQFGVRLTDDGWEWTE